MFSRHDSRRFQGKIVGTSPKPEFITVRFPCWRSGREVAPHDGSSLIWDGIGQMVDFFEQGDPPK
jgi:hypothetical protein